MTVQHDMSLGLFRPPSACEQLREEDHEMTAKGFPGSDWLVLQSTETVSVCPLSAERAGPRCALGRETTLLVREGNPVTTPRCMGCQALQSLDPHCGPLAPR